MLYASKFTSVIIPFSTIFIFAGIRVSYIYIYHGIHEASSRDPGIPSHSRNLKMARRAPSAASVSKSGARGIAVHVIKIIGAVTFSAPPLPITRINETH